VLLPDLVQRTKIFLQGRKGAYCRVFNPEGRDSRLVLEDLARFCRAHTSTADADPRISARLDGRREVFLRIAQHLNLDMETLWSLYGGPTAKGE
jgi:hypothetical protein